MRFEVQSGGKTYEVDAPDQAAAMKALQPLMEQGRQALQQQQPAKPMQGQGSALDTTISGLTGGLGDEAAGVLGGIADWAGLGPEGSKGTFSGGYDRVTGNIRGKVRDYEARHPYVAAATEIAGSLPTMALVPGGAAARGATLMGKVARGAVSGAAVGGIQGFGNAEGGVQNRLEGAAEGAGIGGAIGGALPVAGRAVAKMVGSRGAAAIVPTIDDLETASNSLRDQARQIGMVVKPQTYDNIAADIANVAQNAGVDEGVTPTAYKAMQRILDERYNVQGVRGGVQGSPMTLDKLETIRKVLGNASREKAADFKPTPSAAIATKMLQRLDARMNMLGANDVTQKSGNPQVAVGLIKQSRQLWARKIKADIIQNAIEYGSEAASGEENGIRNAFRALLKPGKYNWTPAERKAIQQVSRGGLSGNLLRFLGTFGFPIDQGRNWLGAMSGLTSGAGGGFALGGPAGAAIGATLPVVGTAAKLAGRALTNKKADFASAVVRSGGVKPFNQAAASAAEAGVNKVLTPLARGSVPLLLPDRREPLKVYIGAPSPGYR